MSQGDPSADLVRRYVAEHYAFYPHRAVWDGRHEHDGTVSDLSPASIQARITALERWDAPLRTARLAATIVPDEPPLAAPDARDLALVEYFRRQELFSLRDWQAHATIPAFYYAMLDLSIYIKRPYAPASVRFDALTRHLLAIPDLLAGARASLRGPCSRLALLNGAGLFEGVAAHYESELAAGARTLAPEVTPQPAFEGALSAAVAALRDFVTFLRARLAERPEGDFALGGNLLQAVIRHLELVDMPLDQLRAWGLDELRSLLARVEELTIQVGGAPSRAFAALSRRRPSEDQVLAAAGVAIDELREFVRAAQLVEIWDEGPFQVDRTPSYLRGGTAFVEPPGPYELPGLPTFVYITLPDPTWSEDQRRAWLNKLNPWGLRNTAAHETYPGHLLHFQHLARNASEAARTFTSFASLEGWAHYGEYLLIEQGYGSGNPRTELAYLAMALLRVCRLLVTLDLHEHAITLREATDFVQRTTHLPLVRCRLEALRAAQDPRIIGYTLGKLLLLRLRDDYARQEGPRYSLRRFHDALLACGAPPLPLTRQMLLRDPGPDPLETL